MGFGSSLNRPWQGQCRPAASVAAERLSAERLAASAGQGVEELGLWGTACGVTAATNGLGVAGTNVSTSQQRRRVATAGLVRGRSFASGKGSATGCGLSHMTPVDHCAIGSPLPPPPGAACTSTSALGSSTGLPALAPLSACCIQSSLVPVGASRNAHDTAGRRGLLTDSSAQARTSRSAPRPAASAGQACAISGSNSHETASRIEESSLVGTGIVHMPSNT